MNKERALEEKIEAAKKEYQQGKTTTLSCDKDIDGFLQTLESREQ